MNPDLQVPKFVKSPVFNQAVRCWSLSALGRRGDIVGRVVQVRKGVGQFGSDIYFLRFPDGSLETFENERLEEWDDSLPVEPSDSEDQTYTIQGEYPATGFIVENCEMPQRAGFFSVAISDDRIVMKI